MRERREEGVKKEDRKDGKGKKIVGEGKEKYKWRKKRKERKNRKKGEKEEREDKINRKIS